MFEVKKTFEISASHFLKLDYESKCSRLHGHNWKITVSCRSMELDKNGMVCDFTWIKKRVCDMLDHCDISQAVIVNGECVNPTAENIARFIADIVGDKCYKVSVEESNGNTAIWRMNDESE